jgi:hypothetical protein
MCRLLWRVWCNLVIKRLSVISVARIKETKIEREKYNDQSWDEQCKNIPYILLANLLWKHGVHRQPRYNVNDADILSQYLRDDIDNYCNSLSNLNYPPIVERLTSENCLLRLQWHYFQHIFLKQTVKYHSTGPNVERFIHSYLAW